MKTSWKRTQLLVIVALTFCLTLGAGTALAEKGGVPNGKPFQAIQSQFDAVQDQIGIIEAGIVDLQDQIDQLVFDTSSLETRIAVNEQFIAELQDENGDIKAQIQDLVDQLQALGQEVDLNAQDIQTLISQHQVNTAKIDYLEQQLADLQVEVDGKQEPLLAGCPAGYAIRNISPEGVATCEEIPENQVAGFTSVSTSYEESDLFTVPPSTRYCELSILGICADWSEWSTPSVTQYVYCDTGWIRAGGGHFFSAGETESQVVSDMPSKIYPNAWYIRLKRTAGTTGTAGAYSIIGCQKFN